MPFVKVVKNKAYFKRYQVKYRRRRECKTDYQQRRRLVVQDKNKYSSPKYRLVVRRTNMKIICQITFATIKGDKVLCQATSQELSKFGLTAGLTNYPAAYCTGLLCARRLLAQLKMADKYKGCEEVTGRWFDVLKTSIGIDRRPFKALLDVGLVHTTIGNRVFGALKGASDGGLLIPHTKGIFPGAKIKDKKLTFDPDKHKARIFGAHIQTYMDALKDADGEKYKKQFNNWIQCLNESKCDGLENLYKKVHEAIRKDPSRAPKKAHKKLPVQYLDEKKSIIQTKKGKYRRDRKTPLAEKKLRINKIIAETKAKAEEMTKKLEDAKAAEAKTEEAKKA